MRAGSLRRKVTIETPTEAQNALGEPIKSWATFAANVPADIAPYNGSERLIAQQVNSQLNTRMTIRYLAGVTTRMRVIYASATGTRTFQIENIENIDERNKQMTLECVESEV